MKLLLSRFDSIYENGLAPADAPQNVEMTVAGNPLLTFNCLRSGAAGVSGDGEGSAGTVAEYDTQKDAWIVSGHEWPFSDIEVLSV